MSSYPSVNVKCGECGEAVILFPRSHKKNHVVLNRLNGNRVVINKQAGNVWYESGKTSDKFLCEACESQLIAEKAK
jgi:hypothetical protein